jgi:hypothetical protein
MEEHKNELYLMDFDNGSIDIDTLEDYNAYLNYMNQKNT